MMEEPFVVVTFIFISSNSSILGIYQFMWKFFCLTNTFDEEVKVQNLHSLPLIPLDEVHMVGSTLE